MQGAGSEATVSLITTSKLKDAVNDLRKTLGLRRVSLIGPIRIGPIKLTLLDPNVSSGHIPHLLVCWL